MAVLIGAASGLFAGLGLGIIRELSDRVFRTSREVQLQLRTNCVAVVPIVLEEEQKKGDKAGRVDRDWVCPMGKELVEGSSWHGLSAL